MSGIRPMAFITAIGAVVGGACGFAVAGPGGIAPGAKGMAAMAVQVAMINKGEEAVDAIAKKADEGVDSAGRKIEALADKTGETLEKIGNVTSKVIQNIADVWSKLLLSGYAINIGMTATHQGMVNFDQFCEHTFQNLGCFTLSMTNLSANSLAIAGAAAGIYHLYKMSISRA